MKKTLSILVLSLLLSANAFSEYYKTGQKISKILEKSSFKRILLSNENIYWKKTLNGFSLV